MARIHMPFNEFSHGSLVAEVCSPDCVEVFYIPTVEKLKDFGMYPDKTTGDRVKLLLSPDRWAGPMPNNFSDQHGRQLYRFP